MRHCPSFLSYKTLLWLIPLIVGDWVFKEWAIFYLSTHHTAMILDLGFFECSLLLVYNKGMAWGLAQEYTQILMTGRAFILLALLLLPWACRKNLMILEFWTKYLSSLSPLAWVLLLAGGFSNLGDMFLRGHVIDMISLQFGMWHSPVFNLADTYITIGAVWASYRYFKRLNMQAITQNKSV